MVEAALWSLRRSIAIGGAALCAARSNSGNGAVCLPLGGAGAMILAASFIPSGPSWATELAYEGLPQWPFKEQAAAVSLFDWSLYAQGRYTYLSKPSGRFALRRLKLRFRGQPLPHLSYLVQGIFKDGTASVTDGRPFLQEARVAYEVWPFLRITAGQFKPPFGMERFTSDATVLLTAERSWATNYLVPDGKLADSFTRDRGIQLDGWVGSGRGYYAFGLFEGEGANNAIKIPSPMATMRFVYRTADDQTIGGRAVSGHLGTAFSIRRDNQLDLGGCCPGPQRLALRRFNGRDVRLNLELAVDWGKLSLRAEYFKAWFHFRDASFPDFAANGWYAQAAGFLHTKWQAVLKFEGFDPNQSEAGKSIYRTTLGLNYYLNDNRAKIMLDYLFIPENKNPFSNNSFSFSKDTVLLQIQYVFR